MYALPAGPTPAPRRQTFVAMSLAVMSMAMLIGGMLAVWLLKRAQAGDAGVSWVPRGVTIAEVPSNVMLVAFIGVCVFAQWAHFAAKNQDRGHTMLALGATMLVAVLIINAQVYVYTQMQMGLTDGTYQMMFYAVTGTFMALMVIGIVMSFVAVFRYAGGRTTDTEFIAAHALYWYATAVIFAALWFVVYVTK
jgi:heme/copper-type cytochrome/quinol oxidase subunit 3